MSFATQTQTAESQDSDDNNDDDDGFAPQPITSRYLSLKAHLSLLKDAIGAVDSFTMSDSDLPAVKWADAVEDALYKRDGCLGEQQGETSYTTDEFKDTYGDSITTPHDDLTEGEESERAELKALFKDSDNHDRDDAMGQFKLPVINGDRLPLLVADEDVLSEAMEMLEAIVEEGNDAPSTSPDVESDEENEFTKAAKAADLDPSVVDATLEGYPVPSAGTVDDLKDTIDVFGINGTQYCPALETLLELEEANKDRKTAKAALKSAIDAFDEESDDDEAGSTSGGMSDDDKEDLAETVATAAAAAVVEALDN